MRRRATWLLAALTLGFPGEAAAGLCPSLWPQSALSYEKSLDSPDPAERRQAIQGLSGLSRSLARRGVTRALLDVDRDNRVLAAQLALRHRYSGLTAEAADWTKSVNPDERILGYQLMAIDATKATVQRLGAALSDSDRAVRREAVVLLGDVGTPHRPDAAQLLLGGLDDSDPQVRAEVAAALGKVGSPGHSLSLAAHLQDEEADVRVQLVIALGVLGEPSVAPALLLALSDQEERVVGAAAEALGRLRFAGAVPGLLALLEGERLSDSGRRAILALTAIGTPAALNGLVDQLSRPDRARFVVKSLNASISQPPPAISRCLEEAVSTELHSCLRIHLHMGGATDPVLAAIDEGRLAPEVAWKLEHTSADRRLVIAALEKLSDEDPTVRGAALEFLARAKELPLEAFQVAVEALKSRPWTRPEMVKLLFALAACEAEQGVSVGKTFLDASHPLVRGAATRLIVRSGADGEELAALLQNPRKDIAHVAFATLREGMSEAQTKVVIKLLVEGKSGRRRLLLDVLFAQSKKISSDVLQPLVTEWDSAQPQERDALIWALARSGKLEWLAGMAERGNEEDLLSLAQVARFHAQGEALALSLLKHPSHRVVALAADSLGDVGSKQAVQPLAALLSEESSRPHFVQAALLRALARLVKRHQLKSLADPEILSEKRCLSQHTGVHAAAHQLADELGTTCHGSGVESLLGHSDPRLRAAGARILRGRSTPDARLAQRRCQAYETREAVAALCAPPALPGPQQPARLPFNQEEITSPWSHGPAVGLPTPFEWGGEIRVFFSDRRGVVHLPTIWQDEVIDPELADALWAY